jgi:peptide chain release factor 2
MSSAATAACSLSSTISGQSATAISVYKEAGIGTIPLLSPHFDNPLKENQTMFEINPVKNRIQDLTERSDVLRGYL